MSSCGGSGSFFDYYSGYNITNKDIFKLKNEMLKAPANKIISE
jgi:hypothetical protein